MKMSGEEFTWGRKFWRRKFRFESSVVKCAGEKYTVSGEFLILQSLPGSIKLLVSWPQFCGLELVISADLGAF